MTLLRETFDDRLEEVRAYLEFITSVDALTRLGAPRLADSDEPITVQQQRLLYAGVYLHLYSLVEATVTQCLVAVADAAKDGAAWSPDDLSEDLLREWVRALARTHVVMGPEKRLETMLAVARDLLAGSAVQEPFEIEKGGGGNWDDVSIVAIGNRLGCELKISPRVYEAVKRKVRDDMGPLSLVKSMRNQLAHGNLSFSESVDEITVSELTSIADAVIAYLGEVVDQFEQFIAERRFLADRHRNVGEAA